MEKVKSGGCTQNVQHHIPTKTKQMKLMRNNLILRMSYQIIPRGKIVPALKEKKHWMH